MIINGIEIDIDFTDADVIERIERGREKILERVAELEKEKTEPAEGIRQECKIIKEFLDYVFGEGTSKKIFGDKNSLRDCIKAYEDIFKERDRQLNNLHEVMSKYSPDRLK